MNYQKTFNHIALTAWSAIALIFFMLSIVLHTAEAYSLFEPAVNYATVDNPGSVAISDLNGDSNPDLATANWGSDNVSVLLNNGDGTFQPAVNFPAGNAAYSIVIGDLDEDGYQDLAVGNVGAVSNISVLLGNGNGTFQPAVNYDTAGDPLSLAIDDLDGDGHLDLVAANGWPGNVSVLLGNGNGTFQPAVNYSAGSGPEFVTTGDLNGDGHPELVVGDGLYVWVLLNNGNGTFQDAVAHYDAGGGAAIGDLDGDGHQDLAVANWETDTVSVLLGNGNGTFQPAVNFPAGDAPCGVAIGDLDGDGHQDLAVSNFWSGNVWVHLGNGDGSFHTALNYGTGAGPHSIAIYDLNGDDGLDMVTANENDDNVSIFINTKAPIDNILDTFIFTYDDFDGNSLDTLRWNFTDPSGVASVSNDFLHVVGPPNQEWLHLNLPQQLSGDFGIMVSFQNFFSDDYIGDLHGSAPGVSLQASWNDTNIQYEAFVGRALFNYGHVFYSGYYPGADTLSALTTSTEGKLFIMRRGSTYLMGYDDGTQTVVLQTFEGGWTGEVSLVLMFSTGYEGIFNVDVDYVKLDHLLLLDAVEELIENGDLEGTGEGASAERRLNAFNNMLINAEALFQDGDIAGACDQLAAASRKCDGKEPPPDLVEGLAVSELHTMVTDLMADFGCE